MEENRDLKSTLFSTSGPDDDFEWVVEEARIGKADFSFKRFIFEEYS